MKKITTLAFLILFFNSFSQSGLLVQTLNTEDGSWSVFQTGSPSNDYGNRREYLHLFVNDFRIRVRNIQLDSFTNKNDGKIIKNLLWLGSDSLIKSSPVDSLPIKWTSITGKPSFSTVATSGSYNDLSSKPTIPAAQINSDWNASSGLSQILNKPTIPTNTNQLTNGSGFLTSVPAQSFSSLTGKPTTLSGYGITDAYPLSGNPSAFISNLSSFSTTNLSEGTNQYFTATRSRSSLSLTTTGTGGTSTYNSSTGLFNIPVSYSFTGSNSQYTKGDGSYGTLPSATTATITSNVSRSLSNSTGTTNQYTISTTNNARVYYTITLSCSTPLLAGSASAQVLLEYSINSGSTWVTVNDISNSQSVGLSVSVAISTPQNFVLTGEIPANALVRLRTVTSGSTAGTATYVRGQEITY